MIRWYRQYTAIARNAFVILVGDPVMLIMLLSVLVLQVFFASIPGFAFGQEMQLIRDQSLALMFISGCAVGVIGAVTVVVRDLQQGAISVLMSRPVSSLGIILGKWTGVAGALLVFQIPVTLSCLWVSKIASEDLALSSNLDNFALTIYCLAIVGALVTMAIRHYLFGGWYVWQANLAICAFFAVGFLISNCFDAEFKLVSFGSEVNWGVAQACFLIFLSQLIFSALLFPFAVKVGPAPLMVTGLVLFFLGLLAEFILQQGGDTQIISSLRAVMPNWQAFWTSDLLTEGRIASPAYVASSCIQTLAFVLGGLSIATWLFNRREFSGTDVF